MGIGLKSFQYIEYTEDMTDFLTKHRRSPLFSFYESLSRFAIEFAELLLYSLPWLTLKEHTKVLFDYDP